MLVHWDFDPFPLLKIGSLNRIKHNSRSKIHFSSEKALECSIPGNYLLRSCLYPHHGPSSVMDLQPGAFGYDRKIKTKLRPRPFSSREEKMLSQKATERNYNFHLSGVVTKRSRGKNTRRRKKKRCVPELLLQRFRNVRNRGSLLS